MILKFRLNVKKSQLSSLDEFLLNNTDFINESGNIKCRFCDFSLNYVTKKGITPLKSHLSTKKHKKFKEMHFMNIQCSKNINLDDKNMHIMFLTMLTKNNLSFKLCDNQLFVGFLKRLGFHVKSSTYYRETCLQKFLKLKGKIFIISTLHNHGT